MVQALGSILSNAKQNGAKTITSPQRPFQLLPHLKKFIFILTTPKRQKSTSKVWIIISGI
jgi:hypothetical protein